MQRDETKWNCIRSICTNTIYNGREQCTYRDERYVTFLYGRANSCSGKGYFVIVSRDDIVELLDTTCRKRARSLCTASSLSYVVYESDTFAPSIITLPIYRHFDVFEIRVQKGL